MLRGSADVTSAAGITPVYKQVLRWQPVDARLTVGTCTGIQMTLSPSD